MASYLYGRKEEGRKMTKKDFSDSQGSFASLSNFLSAGTFPAFGPGLG